MYIILADLKKIPISHDCSFSNYIWHQLFTKSKLIKEDSLTKDQVDEIHCAKKKQHGGDKTLESESGQTKTYTRRNKNKIHCKGIVADL